MSQTNDIPKPTIDGRELQHHDMLEHREYGPVMVESFSYDALGTKKVRLATEMEDDPHVILEYTEEALREAWGEEISDDPEEMLDGLRIEFEGITEPKIDNAPSVDITVDGDDPDAVEVVAIHTRAEAVRAMRAFENQCQPNEVLPHPTTVNWDKVAEGSEK